MSARISQLVKCLPKDLIEKSVKKLFPSQGDPNRPTDTSHEEERPMTTDEEVRAVPHSSGGRKNKSELKKASNVP